MDKRQSRYKLAVYLFLGSLAIILALIGISYIDKDNALQSIFLNLATDILGFVILFFIIEKLFLLDDSRNYGEQIQQLRQEIQLKFNPLYWENPQNYQFELFNHLADAKEIYLLGYMLNVLEKLREILPDLINKGLKVKVLIIDPESVAFKAMLNATKNPRRVQDMLDRNLDYLGQIAKHASAISNRNKGSFEAKLISWIPSCTLVIVKKDKSQGLANVSINSINFDLPPGTIRNRLSMIFNQTGNEQEFEYYLKQFQMLWDSELGRNYDV